VFFEMFTVCGKKSLGAFQDWCKAPENDSGPFTFRANLPKVEEWLNQLKTNSSGSVDLMIFLVLAMLHKEPKRRHLAHDNVRILLNSQGRDVLMCSYH